MNTVLIQRFHFRKPVIFEDIEKGNEVVALSDRIIIRGDAETLKYDLAEMLSRAKLGEKDPLLTTFFFQKDLSQEEQKYARIFYSLCQPLQDAWTYKTMRKYVPDIYQREVEGLLKMWDIAFAGPLKDSDSETRRQVLGMWAILYENPNNKAELIIQAEEYNKQSWNNYIDALKEFIRQEPDIQYYLSLPVKVNSPYEVKLEKEDKFRHFRITTIKGG